MSTQMKDSIITLKNQIAPVGALAKMLRVVKSTICYIFKKKKCTSQLSNTKRPEST